MELKDELNKFYKARNELELKKSKDKYELHFKHSDILKYEEKLLDEKYERILDILFEKTRFEILKNINFKFRQRGFYRTSKGSGYYLRFKGINGNDAIFEITTKAGRRKFKDFKINILSINWVEPISEV